MSNDRVVTFSAELLTPFNVGGFNEDGATVTGEVFGQTIRLQNARLSSGFWLGRVVRIVVQFTGIGAIVLYLVERHIAHLDPNTNKLSIAYALVGMAHWVPLTRSSNTEQQTDAKKRLAALHAALPAIQLQPSRGEIPGQQAQPREDTTPKPKNTPQKKISMQDVGDPSPETGVVPEDCSFHSLTAGGAMVFEIGPWGKKQKITVHNMADFKQLVALSFVDGQGVEVFHLPAGTSCVRSIPYFGHMATKVINIENNELDTVNIYMLENLEQVFIDGHIKKLRFGCGNAKAKLVFGPHAHIIEVEIEDTTVFTEIIVTDGVGVENAKKLIKTATGLKKVDLNFDNISNSQWSEVLAAVPKGCEIICPKCPTVIYNGHA